MELRLLLDADLSWRSVFALKQDFADCFHVDNIGLRACKGYGNLGIREKI
jgi:hypothetical protein